MSICSRCKAPLADAVEGLCPSCLLAAALPLETSAHGPGYSPPSPEQLAGLIPGYEILGLIGQGGMGAVYKARQTKLDRLVALKVLPPAVASAPGFAERFSREARTLARLNHPNIVAVHDFGEAEGLYYLVMEYVEGVNLRQAMADGKVTPERALGVVSALCEALQYAHGAGVVHRDVKPENVLLDRHGRVKVADFGLAKLTGPAQATRLTGTAQAMGTPHYMAPEQWERPAEVDHRADIFSLGVLFYELLTGELPLGNFPPPSQKAGTDQRLDPVVLRAMEREPVRRYQHMSELKTDLDGAEKPAPARPPEIERPLNAAVEVGVTALMLLGILIGATGVVLAWPHLDKKQVANWMPFFVGVTVFLPLLGWVGEDFQNRHFRRFLGLVTLALGGWFLASVLTNGKVPGSEVIGWWGWWLVFGGIPFAGSIVVKSFNPAARYDEDEEESDEEETESDEEGERVQADTALESTGSVTGLTSRLAGLLRLLQEAQGLPDLVTAPRISGLWQKVAREQCEVDDEERVLAILNFAGPRFFPEDDNYALVFGCNGIHWRNDDSDTWWSGCGQLTYEELAEQPCVNHGTSVYLGDGYEIRPQAGDHSINCELLTNLVAAVRDHMRPAA